MQFFKLKVMNMGQHRKPLSSAELTEIRIRSDSADVRALLWEIRRMRQIATRSDQLDRSLGPRVGALGLIRAELRVLLDDEPCIVEMPRIDLSTR